MLTVVIKDNGERNVVKLTYELLWRELKDIEGAELIVAENWFEPLYKTKNTYICFVEADCLVNSGYFTSLTGLIKKNPYLRKLAMLSSAFAVNYWHNRFFGYSLGGIEEDIVVPAREKKSSQPYPVQIGYVPGSLIRVNMLKDLLDAQSASLALWEEDLVFLSAKLSLAFWQQGDGNRTYVNPNTTYVTTEGYVNDIGKFAIETGNLREVFRKEAIS